MLYRILKFWVFCIYLSPFVIIFLAASPLFKILVSPIILWIILRGPLGTYTSRITFCWKLKKICRRAKYTCRFHRTWLGSFWFRREGFDIEIGDRRETVYSIKFFPGNVTEKGIHLRGPDEVEIIRYTVVPHLGRRHAMGRVERTERSRTITDYEMCIARSGESVLLFSPSPFSMTALEKNKINPVGNGETYMGFQIYTARGFLDYIKRKEL
ncbi:MAG: hypothetical protein IJW99_02040 [Clostridia bacterium]|nr:hypothetical protein [Clostridia bacterium]